MEVIRIATAGALMTPPPPAVDRVRPWARPAGAEEPDVAGVQAADRAGTTVDRAAVVAPVTHAKPGEGAHDHGAGSSSRDAPGGRADAWAAARGRLLHVYA